MARAIQKSDFAYEVNDPDTIDTAGFVCLIEMDKFNVGTTDDKIKAPANPSGVYPFHISLYKNENQIGIHPRHIIGEYSPDIAQTTCTVANPKRYVAIPVLTIAQFNQFEIYVEDGDGNNNQPNATIEVNHTADGSEGLIYKIIRKVPERQL